MATYIELRNLAKDSDMLNKTENALAEIIVDILEATDTAAAGYDDTGHALRLKWAVNIGVERVREESEKLLWPILVKNKSLTAAQIGSATVANVVTQMKPFLRAYASIKGV